MHETPPPGSLACEFRRTSPKKRKAIIVDFQRNVVAFWHCHYRREDKLWGLFRRPERFFECRFDDILDVRESHSKGTYYLVVVTAHGRVVLLAKTALFLKPPAHYDQLKAVLRQMARSTPAAPYWESKSGSRLAGCLIFSIWAAIAAAIQIAWTYFRT